MGLVLKADLFDEVQFVLRVLLTLLLLGLLEVSFVDLFLLDKLVDVLDDLLDVHSALGFFKGLTEGELRLNLGHLFLSQEFHQIG